jgi:KaiC domain protein
MSDDDDEADWFERALSEGATEDAPDDWDDWAIDDVHDDWDGDDLQDDWDGDDGNDDWTADDGNDDWAVDDGNDDWTADDWTADDWTADEGYDTEGSDGGGDGPDASDEGSDDDSLFEDDFAAAMGNAPDIAPAGGDASDSGADGGGAFAGGGGGEFGMGGDLQVDDEFGMAGSDFGMGGGDFGMGGGEFDADAEPESDLPRIDLGIEGLDEMIQGGIPKRSLLVTIGSAGTGKTTFALQFLHHALEQGDRAIYVSLEESRERVISSATEKGMSFDEYHEDGQLAVVDLDPVEMANSLRSIRSELPRLIEAFDAQRLVLDSVSLLEMMYDDRAKRRNEIYDFTQSLKRAGVTTMLTSEASDEHSYTSRHGIVEYLTDAVFVLQYVRPDDFRETRLAIEIQKIRDSNHSRETKPYEITNEGISVYRQANIF